jgi:DNA polymerase V
MPGQAEHLQISASKFIFINMASIPVPPLLIPASAQEERSGSPLLLCPVAAGFPSPADDYLAGELNLHRLVVRNPNSTFFLRAVGNSMIEAGILDGDLLVVDRAARFSSGKIVIACVDGEFLVKRFVRRGKKIFLVPENPDYQEIDITDRDESVVWGVVTYAVHKL